MFIEYFASRALMLFFAISRNMNNDRIVETTDSQSVSYIWFVRKRKFISYLITY